MGAANKAAGSCPQARTHLETVAYANVPGANVNATNAVLLVTDIQGNVLDWVELQTGTVGEAVVSGVVTRSAVLSVGSEFTVTQANQTIDARPVIDAVCWTGRDRVVLSFVVETVLRTVLFQVGKGTDYAQWVVVELVTVFQVETVGFVSNALEITLRIASGYGALTSECGTCANC